MALNPIGWPPGSVRWKYTAGPGSIGGTSLTLTNFRQGYHFVLEGADLACDNATGPVSAYVQVQQSGYSLPAAVMELEQSSSSAGGYYTFTWRGGLPCSGNDVLQGFIGDAAASRGHVVFWGYIVPIMDAIFDFTATRGS